MKRTVESMICLGFLGGFLSAAGPPPEEMVVPVDGHVAVTVNGKPLHFIMTPDGISYPVLDPAVATRLSLRKSIFGIQGRVGSTVLSGSTGTVQFGMNGSAAKKRVLWFERAIVPGFDGALGPNAVVQPIITFALHPVRPGERRFTLPLSEQNHSHGTMVTVGTTPIFVQWNLQRSVTLVTAGAGQALAAGNGGLLKGSASLFAIRFGIERPARILNLEQPLAIGPVKVSSVATRVADNGTYGGIADADADPNEIVVTATVKRKPSYLITIGSKDMAGCSSISFNKPAKQIILNCTS